MSEATTAVETTVAEPMKTEAQAPKTSNPAKPRPKPGTKKPAAATAKASKSNPKAPAKGKGKGKKDDKPKGKTIHGVFMPSGKFWNEKRVAIVTALRKLGATSATTSRVPAEIAKKAGSSVEPQNVTRYCAEEEPLVAGGIVKRVKMEGNSEISYYLTALGNKCSLEG